MKLPNLQQAIISREKTVDYLLSPTHRDGRSKAEFFILFGFSREDWETLATALRDHAATHEIAKIETSPFGTRYIVEGAIISPDARNPNVRVVWFVEAGEGVPRLVTAYPLKELT